ncbi:hypothetical protein SLA2020_482250 [Shorea laevis]
MNDQSQMMSQQAIMINQASLPPPPPHQVMGQVQVQTQMLNQSQLIAHSQAMNQMAQSQPMSSAQMRNQPPLMMNRSFKHWTQDANLNPNIKFSSLKQNFAKSNNRSNNWKGKKIPTNENRRMDKYEKPLVMAGLGAGGVGPGGTQGYVPPALNDLQYQNRLKARKFYNKKKFNNNVRFAPYAPRNTTSYIIRAKKSGGIASLVSPCPVTPAVLPTPVFSPSSEVLGDMAKEEWGVDGYGSMKGLIRLRSPGNNDSEVVHDEEEDEEGANGGGSSESDVEEHVEVERRLDHDLSRFEMIYPSYGGGSDYNNVLENRVDDQDTHIAQLEEENLTLKERLFLMESELGDLRRRLQFLERQTQLVVDVNEEVVENGSDNENESERGGSDIRVAGFDDNEQMIEFVAPNDGRRNIRNVDLGVKEEQNDHLMKNEGIKDVCMKEIVLEESTVKEEEKKGEQGKDDEMKIVAAASEIVQGQIVGQKKGETKGAGILGNESATDEMVAEEDTYESRLEEAGDVCGEL